MIKIFEKYDIIVVGAGHAGCEAAISAANMGSSVLLITMNMNLIAQMSCNPSIGGVAKGQLVREIDALGGKTGIVTDETMIQFRMLNKSKGPAMWSPRAQCDRMRFAEKWRYFLENTKNVNFWQDSVTDIIIRKDKAQGVVTRLGLKIKSEAVILANGTFLNGIIHIGEKQFYGGRIGENASFGLTKSLVDFGFESQRLKTGTPVRVDGRTINFKKLVEQKGDEDPGKFSFSKTRYLSKQKSCFIAYTNESVHDVLRSGFERSPLFKGSIKGRGPRYCPSIEDKIVRFSDRIRHQLFIEPEGRSTIECYINGFSSSLPEEIQFNALRKVEGFENVKIFRPGYAIEYDYFPPTQLKNTLETRLIENLYFAGQINGTTGYEEAAAQGLIAGINAHNKIYSRGEFVLKRSQAYIGVLIDDLITKGVEEPYRMFTSRAEYRILLRQDNADIRLMPLGHKLGLVSYQRLNSCERKMMKINNIMTFVKNEFVVPEEINAYLEKLNSALITQKTKIINLLCRPQINIASFVFACVKFQNFLTKLDIHEKEVLEEAEILIKYGSYIEKEREMAEKIVKLENISLSENVDYFNIKSLSTEAREKLNKIKPKTIGQASRISGVSPADITVLLVQLGR